MCYKRHPPPRTTKLHTLAQLRRRLTRDANYTVRELNTTCTCPIFEDIAIRLYGAAFLSSTACFSAAPALHDKMVSFAPSTHFSQSCSFARRLRHAKIDVSFSTSLATVAT